MRYNPQKPTSVSKPNKEMIEYMNKSIDQINSTGVEIKIILIDEDDNQSLKMLEKKGVKKLPALFAKEFKEPIEKVDKIKKFLSSSLKSKRKLPSKSSGEELRDFQWGVLAAGDEEDREGKDKQKESEIRARLDMERKRRDKHNRRTEKPLTPDEIVANERKKYAANSRRKQNDDYESDEEDEPKSRGRNRNDDPDPAEIMSTMPATSQDQALDNDLASKFWAGRGIGTD
jgi:hypothetical protein